MICWLDYGEQRPDQNTKYVFRKTADEWMITFIKYLAAQICGREKISHTQKTTQTRDTIQFEKTVHSREHERVEN